MPPPRMARSAMPRMMSRRRVELFCGDGAASFGVSFESLMLLSWSLFRRRGRCERCRIPWSVPPPAAERSEERGRVGEALYVRLHLREHGLLVLLLSGQHLQLGVLAGVILLERQVETGACSGQCLAVRGVVLGVVLQSPERIRHLDEGSEHGRAVAGSRLPVALLCLMLARGEG